MKWPIEFVFTERYNHLAIPCRWVLDLKKYISYVSYSYQL